MENVMFDYQSLGEDLAVPAEVVLEFEKDAVNEFPSDNMMRGIHVLRVVKAHGEGNYLQNHIMVL